MGRKVRRVPKDWVHPVKKVFDPFKRIEVESYQPMFDRPFAEEMDEWYAEWKAWERGERPDWCRGDNTNMPYWEWNDGPPDPFYFRPDWPEESRTHLMMYEECSEGTPISPAFETPEELARWLADNGASSFGSSTATYEQWLRVCKGGYAPSMVISPEHGIQSGVEAGLSSNT